MLKLKWFFLDNFKMLKMVKMLNQVEEDESQIIFMAMKCSQESYIYIKIWYIREYLMCDLAFA